MTEPRVLEAYLHEHIPLSRHIGVRALHADDGQVRLHAPLEPNLNHRQTAFGGSIAALAILAGWSLLWLRLHGRTPGHQIVIHSSAVDYTAPAVADLEAVCSAPPAERWQRFLRTFESRGRGRIELLADVTAGGAQVARFRGVYVALRPD
jgi:thioesterase domain-containing protein